MKNNNLQIINIFLSFSSKDKEIVTLFKTLLKALDKEDRINYHDYSEGSNLYESSTYSKILSQINGSRIFISFLSENYLKSILCCWESGIAAQKNKQLKVINGENTECKVKSDFSFIGLNCYSESKLELFHTSDNIYSFPTDIISKDGILDRIKKDASLNFAEYPDSISSNSQKEFEKLILNRVIKRNEMDDDSEKMKILKG